MLEAPQNQQDVHLAIMIKSVAKSITLARKYDRKQVGEVIIG